MQFNCREHWILWSKNGCFSFSQSARDLQRAHRLGLLLFSARLAKLFWQWRRCI